MAMQKLLFCAVDRKPLLERQEYFALTVTRHDGQIVMLVFCEKHFDERNAMYEVISREGWV
jgi:benzoyl-CoA reductase/2-hydroxyglutaryl-CoA dehydratase subunit BcrC/BadD/HgdB